MFRGQAHARSLQVVNAADGVNLLDFAAFGSWEQIKTCTPWLGTCTPCGGKSVKRDDLT